MFVVVQFMIIIILNNVNICYSFLLRICLVHGRYKKDVCVTDMMDVLVILHQNVSWKSLFRVFLIKFRKNALLSGIWCPSIYLSFLCLKRNDQKNYFEWILCTNFRHEATILEYFKNRIKSSFLSCNFLWFFGFVFVISRFLKV